MARISALLRIALIFAAAFVLLAGGSSFAQVPSSGNGAKRFDDLRELNNKLARTINEYGPRIRRESHLSDRDLERLRRTLKDLETTKLRAVDQFPPVFGLPYGETFRRLSCIDEQFAIDQEIITGMLPGGRSHQRHIGGITDPARHLDLIYFQLRLLDTLARAKSCKDALEAELASAPVPTGITDDLRELNNKLARTINEYGPRIRRESHLSDRDLERLRRTLNDLETTKLHAVDQFPEILDPPYGETFRRLSCIDEQFAIDQEIITGMLPGGRSHQRHIGGITDPARHLDLIYFQLRLLDTLERAKGCKDTIEVELMHSFDLKPSGQSQVGVNPTTPNGTDIQNPNKLNAPKPLEHAYARDGFVGRHEHDYVATGINAANPESWPPGKNVVFFNAFDLFGSPGGAHKAAVASEQNLKSSGFLRVSDSSLGSGEAVFQKQPVGSPVLSTIIYVQRGTFILKIAGSCRGCQAGSIEPSLKQVAEVQLNRAVINGFPGSSGSGGSGGSTGCSGDANLTVTLSGNPAPSGANFDFPSAIPASCNIGIRNNGSGTAGSNWSSDVHDASNASAVYFCHDGPPGTPPGESACPGTQQPSSFAGGSLYQDVFKASDGTWHISMQVFTRQSYNVTVRVHYSWTTCTGPSC